MTIVQSALEPSVAVATANTPFEITVDIVNTSSAIDAYTVSVFGLDRKWVTVEPSRPTLFPGESVKVAIRFLLPDSFPAGTRQCTVYVASHNQPDQFNAMPLALMVGARDQLSLTVDPVNITGRRRTQFGLVIANHGNTTAEIQPIATDPEDLTRVRFEPPFVHLLPNQQAVVKADVTAPQPWIGAPKVRVITFQAGRPTDDDPAPASATGTFMQRAKIGRLAISLLGLLTAAAVFAAVLSHAFNNVVDEAKVDDRLVNEALAKDRASGAAVSVRPAVINGRVMSASTGEGVAGAQVQLFRSDNSMVAVASAATGDDGSFAFARLNAGTYRVKLSGAGFGLLWYPAGQTFADSADVVIDTGATVTLEPVVMSGQSGSISGTVVTADPVGATATLVIPGRNDPTVPAVVDAVKVGADGSFALPDVPTPGVYELVIEKPGSGIVSRSLVLAPAEQVSGLKVVLGEAGGVITGRITARGAPVGGVKIEATSGSETVSTVSLTTGDVGFFALRGLAPQSRYTLTISLDGYRVESRTVLVDQASTSIDVALSAATGSVSGKVYGPGNVPLGGVTVNITGGQTPVSTSTISAGAAVGEWSMTALALPGSYTVTFSKDGYVSQTRRVSLDEATGGFVAGIDAALAPSTATVTGQVIDADGLPVAHADVTLGDASTPRSMLSADQAPGAFSFSGVAPGSYTITAARTGSVSVVQVVSVRAGETATYTLQLGRQASFTGTVTHDGQAYVGAQVRLYKPADFPGTASAAIATVTVGTDGAYTFTELTAPADFVIAVYPPGSQVEAADSQLVGSVPGTEVEVSPFSFTTPAAAGP